MLKTRVLSALVALIILFAVALGPSYLLKGAVFIIALICIYEFFKTMKVSSVVFMIIGFITSVPLIFFYNEMNVVYYTIFLTVLFSFVLVILDNDKKNTNDIFITLFGTIFISFCISHILKIREMQDGNLLIWLVFLGAWITDTFAYFIGVRFGSHKLSPISPKKSVEGSIGGMVGTLIVITAYGYIINSLYNVEYSMFIYVAIAIISGVTAQIGDLAASLLKRSVNIKDFGDIMPGHGGAIDRIDSILFVAPAIYYYLIFFVQ